MRTARNGGPSARRLPAGSRKPARDSAGRRSSRRLEEAALRAAAVLILAQPAE